MLKSILTLAMSIAVTAGSLAAESRPNIVVVLADDCTFRDLELR